MDFEEWLQKTLVQKNLLPKQVIDKVLEQQSQHLIETGESVAFSTIIEKKFGQHVGFASLKQQFITLMKTSQTVDVQQAVQVNNSNLSGNIQTIDVKQDHWSVATSQGNNSDGDLQTIDISAQEMHKHMQAPKQDYKEKTFGRYTIVKKLGEGNAGAVFLAYDPKLDRNIALKILLSKNNSDIHISRFYREAQAISKMRHQNIANAYDIGNEKGTFYFTMDYIEGKSLFEVLEEKKIPFNQSAKWVEKIARALFYAHERNIVHRDIKPANIMIDDNKEPYLMDFGLAREIEGGKRISKSGTIAGTPSYMSPEQARGIGKEIDSRSDIYSLGATLYKMITGQLVFRGNTLLETLFKVTNEAPISPCEIDSKIPQELSDICMKCLEKDKDKRYQTAEQMANELKRYLLRSKRKPVTSPKNANAIKNFDFKWVAIAFLLVMSTLLFIYNLQLQRENKQLNKDILKLKQQLQKE